MSKGFSKKLQKQFQLVREGEDEELVLQAKKKVLNENGIDEDDIIAENFDELQQFRSKARKDNDKPLLKQFAKEDLPRLPARLQNSRIIDIETNKKSLLATIPLAEDPIIMNFAGAGYPLMFAFMKYCIYILVAILLSSGSYNFFSSWLLGKDCIDDTVDGENIDYSTTCIRTFTSKFSNANKRNNVSLNQLQDILNFFTIITIMVLFQFIRRQIRQIEKEVDHTLVNIQDYSIFIENLNFETHNRDYREQIKEFFKNAITPNQDYGVVDYSTFEVTEVSLSINSQEIDELEKQKAVIIADYKKAMKARLDEGHNYRSTDEKEFLRKWADKENEIDKLAHLISGENSTPESLDYIKRNFNNKAFISFSESEMSDEIIERFSNENKTWFSKTETLEFPEHSGNYLEVNSPPHPTNVNWENLSCSDKEKKRRVLGMNILYYGILFGVFLVIYFLNVIKTSYVRELNEAGQEQDQEEIKYLKYKVKTIVYAITYSILGINSVLGSLVFPWMSNFKKCSTKTKTILSNCQFNAIGKFINTAVMTIIIQVVMKRYFASYQGTETLWTDPTLGSEQFFWDHNKKVGAASIYKQGGLLYIQHNLIIQTILLSFILVAIDYQYWLMFKLKRWAFERFKLDQTMTKKEIETLNTPPVFNMGEVYGKIIMIVFTACFYAPLIPIALVYTIIGITFFYWCVKYVLLRQRSIKTNISSDIAVEMVELLELLLPLYCLSNLSFELLMSDKEKVSYWAIAGIIIGILHAILPMEKVNILLTEYDDEPPEVISHYYTSYETFTTDYHRQNPATVEYYDDKKINEIKSKYKTVSQQYDNRRKFHEHINE